MYIQNTKKEKDTESNYIQQNNAFLSIKDNKKEYFVREKTGRFIAVFLKVKKGVEYDDVLEKMVKDTILCLFSAEGKSEEVKNALLKAKTLTTILIRLSILNKEAGSILSQGIDDFYNEMEEKKREEEKHTPSSFSYHPFGEEEVFLSLLKENSSFKESDEEKKRHNESVYKEKDIKTEKEEKRTSPQKSKKSEQKNRRAQILSILQHKDSVNVKDISALITECSEKTLQRELSVLHKQNVLKKEGERRWSRYSLI
jgi:hypothetical protein